MPQPRLLSEIVTARQFKILFYRFHESGYTWKDIAMKLGCSEPTVKRDMASAEEKIRNARKVQINFDVM